MSRRGSKQKRTPANTSLRRQHPRSLGTIADLVGSVDGLPTDLAVRKKDYLKATGYGRKHGR